MCRVSFSSRDDASLGSGVGEWAVGEWKRERKKGPGFLFFCKVRLPIMCSPHAPKFRFQGPTAKRCVASVVSPARPPHSEGIDKVEYQMQGREGSLAKLFTVVLLRYLDPAFRRKDNTGKGNR